MATIEFMRRLLLFEASTIRNRTGGGVIVARRERSYFAENACDAVKSQARGVGRELDLLTTTFRYHRSPEPAETEDHCRHVSTIVRRSRSNWSITTQAFDRARDQDYPGCCIDRQCEF
jgi:hypothetical protein